MSRRGAIVAAAAVAALVSTAGCRPGSSARRGAGETTTITIIATNDLHGNLVRLPLLAGYVQAVRAERDQAGGGVLLLDAGDMLHGTLESNMTEGAAVIRAYNAMGYDAAAIGNHDFDFDVVTADNREPVPHAALRARAAEAQFPLLSANVIERATGAPLRWHNVLPSVMLEVRGVAVGLIGVATEDLPRVVRRDSFSGLAITPMVAAIELWARALRRRGARLVIVVAHAGGRCATFDDPGDLSSCNLESGEIFRAAASLPVGLVDVIVAGHNHSGIAHRVNGIAIVESFSHGLAFGRVDLELTANGVRSMHVWRPHPLCELGDRDDTCVPGSYAGAEIQSIAAIERLLEPDLARAHPRISETLGVVVTVPVWRSQIAESPLGNLLVDLMASAGPGADLVLQNGGALRTELPAGPLRYGDLFRAMSFDNHFAIITAPASAITRDLAGHLTQTPDLFSVSGARVVVSCRDGRVKLTLLRPDGSEIDDSETITVLTSDFLATGGDGLFTRDTLDGARVSFPAGPLIRDAMARVLQSRGGELRGDDPALYDPARPRVDVSSARPLRCSQP